MERYQFRAAARAPGAEGSFFQTDVEAPRKRVIGIDLRHPEREHWREIIAQAGGVRAYDEHVRRTKEPPLQQEVQESVRRQSEIEAADSMSFDEYLKAWFEAD